MLDLLEMSTAVRALIMTVLFAVVAVNMFCIPNLFIREYKVITKLVMLIANAAGFYLCTVTATGLNCVFKDMEIPHFSLVLLENSEYVLLYILANIAFLSFIAVGEYRYRKNSVTTSSIKESFDYLPTGLCFSKANGTVQLVNHKMNELSYLLTGEELQNANLFWKTLCNGKIQPDVQRISGGSQPEFKLKSGEIYTFARKRVEKVFQLTATDTTNLHRLKNRLIDNNEELEEMNTRLRLYGENVDETTRARERLETKIRIHSELGQALLATRHCLHQPDANLQAVMNSWKRNIAVLRTETEPSQSTDLLRSLIEVAESAGVRVELRGDMPAEDNIGSLLISAATEALTNAVRHAQATTLFAQFDESEDYFFARYTNDGIPPEGEIKEGGGLGSLRSKIERFAGEMEISSLPEFVLTVKLPKEVNRF